MRVAYYSPLPPDRSGIADYSALLVPALDRRIELKVVGGRPRRAPRVDLHVYHVGNDPQSHGWIVDELKQRPGLVVLHDFVMHHLVAGLTLGRNDPNGYLDAMQEEAGVVGRSLAHAVIDGLLPPLWEVRPHDFPLVRPVLGLAKGLIVHSAYVETRVREAGYGGPIWRIPMPTWPDPPAPDPPSAPTGEPLVFSAGNLTASKRIPQLLTAFAHLKRSAPGAKLVLAGAASGIDVPLLLRAAHLTTADVTVLGRIDEERLWGLLHACDVCVNLRWPTMGETSGIAIRALAAGKPLIVSDVGWFAELPASAALRVPVDDWEVDVLAAYLERLAADPDLRRALGTAGRDLARSEHDLGRVADAYVAAFEQALGGPAVRDAVLYEIAEAARDVGLRWHDREVVDIASLLQEAGLGR